MAKQYKVEVVQEGIIGTLLLGASTLPVANMEAIMNRRAKEGWNMDFMVVENRRLFLFWTREAAIITFSKS